ncbi:MAG: MMPL family transporter, partial [Ferruginibacter sp.]|nr:MMPL family transporter [Cytophagales bacterium]
KAVFGEKDIVLIGIESDDIFRRSTLEKIALISEELKKVDGVVGDEITSLSTLNNIEGKEWGLEVGPLMRTIPRTDAGMAQLKKEVAANELVTGRLVSKDGRFTAIVANIEKHSNQGQVFQQVERIAKQYGNPERIFLAGAPVQQQEIDAGIQQDVGLLLPISLLLVLLSFFISFRTVLGVVLPFVVVLLSIVWTMGMMGYFGFKMNVVSSAIPLLMIAASSSYGIHMMQRYYEESGNEDHLASIRDATAHILPAILITGLTSVIGMATLVVFRVTSIREFGVITAAGTLITMILPVTVIPAWLALTKRTPPRRKAGRAAAFDRVLIRLARFSIQRARAIVTATVIILVVSSVGIYRVRVGTDFIQYFPEGHRLRVTFEKFNEQLGGARTLDVMVDGNAPGSIQSPDLLRKIVAFQQYAEGLPGVGYTSSFADIIRRMHAQLNEGDSTYRRIPDSREMIAQLLLLYAMSGDPGDFNELVDYDYQRAKIRFMLNTSEQDDHQKIYDALKQYATTHFGPEVKLDFGGEVMFWLSQVRYIVRGKIENIITGVLFVGAFCLLVFRSLAGGVLSIVPLTISTVITFGVMGYAGLRLETGTAIITAIVIGIGVDFAIHYLMRFREKMRETNDFEATAIDTMLTSGKSIVFNVLSNVLGFSVFIFSGFLPIRYFGWLICLTMLTVALGSLIIFPSLFLVFRPRFIWGTTRRQRATPAPELVAPR